MIGRQVILTNRSFTLEELESFMRQHWDAAAHNEFSLGRPTPFSIEQYLLLPATDYFLVAVYPRKAGSLLSKENKVVLTVCDSPAGAEERLKKHSPLRRQIEKERKGPAEEALQGYAAYMRSLLESVGFVK